MFGVVTLSFWAIATATDYSSGLIRLLVAAEPQRWRLLAGKVLALAGVTAIATGVALIVNMLVAMPVASAAGISTEAWGQNLPATLAGAWVNAYAAMLVWGVIGLVLAVLTRSSAVAISIGVGYVLVIESVVKMAMGEGADLLLGSTLSALAAGGTASLAYGTALTLAVGYVIIALGLAGVVVTRRDITD